MAERGIARERLLLVGEEAGVYEHLQRYCQVDIALDTFPYHGTTTTCDALWMGTPVVVLAGNSHVSRVGCSLLTAAGLPRLIAASPQEYVRIACLLAADWERLRQVRLGIRPALLRSPLLDAARFTGNLESALPAGNGPTTQPGAGRRRLSVRA